MTQQPYSNMQFMRPTSLIDILTNEFIPHRLLDEMPLTRLRDIQLLLVDNLLNREVHADGAFHHFGRRLASQFLEFLKIPQHRLVARPGMKPLVDWEVPPIAHAQRNGEHPLNRGGVA